MHLSQDISGSNIDKYCSESLDKTKFFSHPTDQTGGSEYSPLSKILNLDGTVVNNINGFGVHERRRRKRQRNGVTAVQYAISEGDSSQSLLEQSQASTTPKRKITGENSSSQDDGASQLRYVYQLLQSDSPSVCDIRMALPSIRALAHDETLLDSESRSLVKSVNDLVTNLQHACETYSPREQISLSREERKVILEALKASKLLQLENSTAHVTRAIGDGYLPPTSWVEESSSNRARIQKEIAALIDLFLDAANRTKLDKNTYKQIKEYINLLILEADNPSSVLVAEMAAPPTLIQSLDKFTTHMDREFENTEGLEIDLQTHNIMRDLVTRLTPLITSFDPQRLEFGLQTLYDAAIGPEAFRTHKIKMDHFASASVLRALEVALREHHLSSETQNSSSNGPKNLWPVVAHLINRLSDDLASQLFNFQTNCSTLDSKEGILVQHVLLGALSDHGVVRSPEERETDSAFFQFCSRQTETDRNGHHGGRSPELLSPISELCTPDTSTYDTENTIPEGANVSPRNQSQSFHSFSGHLSETEDLGEQTGKIPQSTDEITFKKNGYVTDSTKSKLSMPILNNECEVKSHSASSYAVPQKGKEIMVAVNRSTARQLSSYLRSKLLDNLTSSETSALDRESNKSLESLSTEVDQSLAKTATGDHIKLSTQNMKKIEDILASDETPYARILRRCLEPQLSVTSSDEFHANATNPITKKASEDTFVDTPLSLRELAATAMERVGQYLTQDEVKQLACTILHYSKKDSQISVPGEVIEMACDWLQSPRSILVTRTMTDRMRMVTRTSLLDTDTTLNVGSTSCKKSDSQLDTVLAELNDKSSSGTDKYSLPQEISTEPNLTTLTSATERIRSVVVNNVDWESFNFEEKQEIAQCIQLLANEYPEMNLSTNVNLENLSELWPKVRMETENLAKLEKYIQKWESAKEVLLSHTKPESAQIAEASEAELIADIIKASVTRIVSEADYHLFTPTQTTSALQLAQRLTEAVQSETQTKLQTFEQQILAELVSALTDTKLSGHGHPKGANWPIIQGLLSEITESGTMNELGEIRLLSSDCVTLLTQLPKHIADSSCQHDLSLIRSHLIKILSEGQKMAKRSTIERWKSAVGRMVLPVALTASPEQTSCELMGTIDKLKADPNSVSSETLRKSVRENLNREFSIACADTSQQVRLARATQILMADIPLRNADVITVIEEVRRPASTTLTSVNQAHLAATQIRAILTLQRTSGENGMIMIKADDCAQLAESSRILMSCKDAQSEVGGDHIFQSFVKQMFVGALNGEGSVVSPTTVQTLTSQMDQMRTKLTARQDRIPTTVAMTRRPQDRGAFDSSVFNHLQKCILEEKVSLQAWHAVRELASLTPRSSLSWDWQQVEHRMKIILARITIHKEVGDFFDMSQKCIAISFLNQMQMCLACNDQDTDFWTVEDGYTFAFMLGQLAWRNSNDKVEQDQGIIYLVAKWLAELSESRTLPADPDIRHRLLEVARHQSGRLNSELLKSMDPKLWINLTQYEPQISTEFKTKKTQQYASFVALVAAVSISHDDISEPLSSQHQRFADLINNVLHTMNATEWEASRGDLEILCQQLKGEDKTGSSHSPSGVNELNRLDVIEGVEISLLILNTGVINDQAEALTLLAQLTILEQFIHGARSVSPMKLKMLKNVLVCLLASSSDTFPFHLHCKLNDCAIGFVKEVDQFYRKPVKSIVQSALEYFQGNPLIENENSKQKIDHFVRTSTPLECFAESEENMANAGNAVTLLPSEQTQVATAITMALASGYSVRPEQAKPLSDVLLRLQSTETGPIMLTHTEVATVTELFNFVLSDDSLACHAMSSKKTYQLTEEYESPSVLDDILLNTDPVLLPKNALHLNSSLTLALQHPQVQQELSQNEKRSIDAVRRRLLFAALKGQTVDVSQVQPVLQHISQIMKTNQIGNDTDTVIRRLQKLTRSNVSVHENSPEDGHRIDAETSELLHQCLYEKIRLRPTTLATTLPILSVITELEAPNEPTTSTEFLNEDSPQLYGSLSLSSKELRTVTEFLRNSNKSSANSVTIQTSEKITAFLLVRNVADGESIWPSEARLLLSALETLALSNSVTNRYITTELAGLKINLLSSADIEESMQNLYEGSGFTPSEAEINKLKALSTTVATELDEEVAQLINGVQIETKRSRLSCCMKLSCDQVRELCRIFLLYLCSKSIPKLHELALMNRVAFGLNMDPRDPHISALVSAMCSSPIRFSQSEDVPCTVAVDHVTRTVPAFIPDLLEQALNQGQTQLSFRPSGALLVSNILNFLALLDFQPGCDRLVPKWSSHLKRLALQILYSALLDHSVRLDVRSRALLSIAYRYYRSNLTDVSQNMVDVADETLRGKTALQDLDSSHRDRVAECLCVALASPMRYNLSPVRAGFIASLTESLQLTGRQMTFDAADMQLVCETVHSLSDLENKVRVCPSDTFTILSCLQNAEQFLDLYEQSGPEHTVLSRRDAAVVGAALEVLMNVSTSDPPFESWDSDDPTTLSQECRSVIGLTQCFLSSLAIGAHLPGQAQQSATISQTELSNIKQLINYWKPRLLLDAQRQRTSSIRKLSVSTECDLTADITNQQLANAVQLTVIHGKITQPQDAWLCIQTLEQLVRSPANDYISISNSQRDALRLAMCPVRSSSLPSNTLSSTVNQVDPNLLTCMTYLHRILTASTTTTFGHRARFCVQPADVAAFATSLRILLDSFVGDLTHKEAFAILRVMEQRMRCTAANLEAYWIAQPESRAIREVLRYLYGQLGKTASDQLSRLLDHTERSAMSIHNGERAVELDNQEQALLLQSLRSHILLAPDSLPVDYGDLIELTDYLMYARPASLTEIQLSLLRQLHTCELQQVAVQMQRNSSSELWFKAFRSSLNHLTRWNSSHTPVLASNYMYIHPREAASLFCILNALNACSKCVDPSLVLLQSALAHCVVNGQIWTTWSALPPNSQLRVRQALGNCVDDLVERLFESHASTWSAHEWASLEIAEENMLHLLEENDSVLLGEGLTKLRLISLLIPGDQISTGHTTFSRPPHVSRYQPIPCEQPGTEEPDSGSLLDAIQCLEMTIKCDNVMSNPKNCLDAMRAVHVLRYAPDTLQTGSQDKLLLQNLEGILFDLATRSLKEGHLNSSVRFELRSLPSLPFSRLENLIQRIQTQWAAHEAKLTGSENEANDGIQLTDHDAVEHDTSKVLSLDMLGSTPASSISTVEFCVPLESVHQTLDRFRNLCHAGILKPEEIAELISAVDLLYNATGQPTPRLRGYTQFSPGERKILCNLQVATENNHGYTLSTEAADTLQNLGQRLSALVLQSNQDLLRNGLELWLTASVDGRFVFDDRETLQLHSALRLARDTLRKNKLRTTSEEALGVVDTVIEQFSSTVDSGIGTEVTGPYCVGPAVTEVLEGAQRAHEMLSIPGSSMSGVPTSPLEWCTNYPSTGGLQRKNEATLGTDSTSTDGDGITEQLDNNMRKSPAHLTYQTAVTEMEWSRPFTSDGHLSAAAGNLSTCIVLNSEKIAGETCPNRRHTIDQVVDTSLLRDSQRSYLYPKTTLAFATDEHKRLKKCEKLVEARLTQACKRVESLLAALPKSADQSGATKAISLDEKYMEVDRLRAEVLGLKEQLAGVVKQLESTERIQRRQTQFSSSMRELIDNKRQLRSHLLTERAGLFSSADSSQRDRVGGRQDSGCNVRLYRSSDCLKELSPTAITTGVTTNVIHPHHSQVILYKPIESEALDLTLTPRSQNRFSSLDRLHELIEIRRAVVAGSREELCRLGVYSSLPLKFGKGLSLQRPVIPHTTEKDKKQNARGEPSSGPRILHRLLERQRNYTKHLLGRASYEQDQNSRVLDALEDRLTNLEQQVTSAGSTAGSESHDTVT